MSVIEKPVVTPERVTPLKPSEAMRFGRWLVPQGVVDSYFTYDGNGKPVAACALGAMLIGFGDDLTNGYTQRICRRLDGMTGGLPVRCPRGCGRENHLDYIIAHLNDDHAADTDEIASWLEEQGL